MLCLYCCCSFTKSCLTLWNPINCSVPGFPVLHYLPEFAQTLVHWVSDAIQPSLFSVTPFFSCPQSFPSSGSFPMSWLFTSGCQHYWSLSFNHSSSNEYSMLISFKTGQFDFLAVQGTLKSLLQHHSSKSSFFSAQPSLWSTSHIHT